ncbi:MAG: hypothetical protein AAF797_12315 [Planctomycetota bacterium]
MIIAASTLALPTAGDDATITLKHDLCERDATAFYDFNVDLLTHLGQRIMLDVTVAAEDFSPEEGWILSSYYITPDELRGIELRVPKSAIVEDGNGRLRVKGQFRLSEVMSQKQGQISLHLLAVD